MLVTAHSRLTIANSAALGSTKGAALAPALHRKHAAVHGTKLVGHQQEVRTCASVTFGVSRLCDSQATGEGGSEAGPVVALLLRSNAVLLFLVTYVCPPAVDAA